MRTNRDRQFYSHRKRTRLGRMLTWCLGLITRVCLRATRAWDPALLSEGLLPSAAGNHCVLIGAGGYYMDSLATCSESGHASNESAAFGYHFAATVPVR